MKQKADLAVTTPAAGRVAREEQLTGIGAVERDTGLSKDTLRVWERRYGFPKPERDAFGERVYPREQVEKLRVVKRLMDNGHRPGKIIQCSMGELKALSDESETGLRHAAIPRGLERFVEMVRTHQVEELRRALGQEMARSGLGGFVTGVAAPLNVVVGELWTQGELEIFEEHLYTESMQAVLRNAIGNVPAGTTPPRILLTTFPNEQHGLGLLMAEAMLVLEGVQCVSLGVETPLSDIVHAAGTQGADIVALSFSLAYPVTQATDGLAELRRCLPERIDIWAGGGSGVLGRRLPDGVQPMNDLSMVNEAVGRWRTRRA